MPLATGASIVGGILGSGLGRSKGLGMLKRQIQHQRNMVVLGNQMDIANQKEMFNFRMDYGGKLGLTPTELFGSPASGGTGGTTGSAQVLGNVPMFQQAAQNQQSNEMQSRQIAADLLKTKMTTDAQKYTADTQAGVTARGQDFDYLLRHGQLKLNQDTYENVTLKQAAANIGKTEQETKKLIEDTLTATPAFKRSQTLLSMGVDNSVNTMLQKRFGIDVTSEEEMANLNEEQFRNVLAVFIAAGSTANRELQGFLSALPGNKGQFNLNPLNSDLDPNSSANLGNDQSNYSTRGRRRKRHGR